MPDESHPYDGLQRRCPRLGGLVPFRYCRNGAAAPEICFKVLDCWWERFDVVGFFKDRLSSEAFAKLHSPPTPDKISSLIELVNQARQSANRKDTP
jgi:hypothetical protein